MSYVLTLAFDDASQQRFEELRQRWYPPELNRVPAHLTLFHTLPEDDRTPAVLEDVAQRYSQHPVEVTGVQSLGRGAALKLHSPESVALHRELQRAFEAVLTRQDQQGFRPHVVVQNKVEPSVARQTLATLSADFAPWTATAVGLDLWAYLGGPWQHVRRFAFSAAQTLSCR